MKRNSFIKFCLAAAAFPLTPLNVQAGKRRIKKGIKVDSGKDRFDKPLALYEGDTFYSKVSATDTNGDLYIFDSTRIKEGGPALHYHYSQDEWWYIISGEFLIKVGDETYHAKAGDSVFGPRGVPHTFAKVGEGEGKLIMLFQPAGKMEKFFKAVSEGLVAKMSDEEKQKFRKAHGFEQVGPPLTYLKKY